MGVLLSDLPCAEAQTKALSDAIRSAGLGAHEQAASLDATLSALVAGAKEAETGAAGAANRLSAQVSQIASASEVAIADIDEAGRRMSSSVDSVLERAAEAVERTRQGVAAQGDAIEAMMERARVSADAAGAEAAHALEARIAGLGTEIGRVASQLSSQDGVGAALIERIQRGLATIEARFAELDETGRARTERLGEALGALGGHAERTMTALNHSGTAATTLINRAETLKAAVAACLQELGETLPDALSRLEEQAARSRAAIGEAGPEVERLHAVANEATEALDNARISLDERRIDIEA